MEGFFLLFGWLDESVHSVFMFSCWRSGARSPGQSPVRAVGRLQPELMTGGGGGVGRVSVDIKVRSVPTRVTASVRIAEDDKFKSTYVQFLREFPFSWLLMRLRQSHG